MSTLWAALTALAFQGSDTFTVAPPAADSYLHEAPADKNCSNHKKIMVSAWDAKPGEHRRSILRFDLAVLEGKGAVRKATLRLKLNRVDGRLAPVEIVQLDRGWRLRDAAWSFGFKGIRIGRGLPETKDGWHAFDVTPAVQAWKEGAANHGLMLSVASEEGTRCQLSYASSRADVAADRPQLVIEAPDAPFPVGPLVAVPAMRQRKEWTRHSILVWQTKTDVRKDAPLYESVGLKGFHIDRGAGREDLVRLSKEKGYPYYVDHAAGKGDLHLTNEDALKIQRTRQVVVRPNSLADPLTIARLKRELRRNVAATRGGMVYAYAFDDEISLGRFNSPSEVDGHPRSVAWYRAWLKHRYGSLDALNKAWGSSYGSLGDVRPTSFEDVREKHATPPLRDWNLSRWMEWRHFMDYQFSTVLADLTRTTNRLAPGVPAGFVGGQAPSAYGGYDYALMSRAVQWMEAYDINGTAEILRSFWARPRRIRMQTYFTRDDVSRNTWLLWYRLVAGHQANIAWPDGWFVTNAASGKREPAPKVRALAPVLREVQGSASEFLTHPDTDLDYDPIGIYYSHPSIRAGWAMDAITHRKTWVSRSSSLESGNSAMGFLRVSWCKLLEDLGYQYRYISYLDVQERKAVPPEYKVIILPRTVCLSDVEAGALRKFVAEGGTLLADSMCGLLTETGKGRARGVLDDLFAVRRDESKGYLDGRTLFEIDGERGRQPLEGRLHAYPAAIKHGNMIVFERGTRGEGAERSEAAGTAEVVIRKGHGGGRTVYLNLSPLAYRHMPFRRGAMGDQWRALVGPILKTAGVAPRVEILENGKAPAFIEALFWERGKTVCLALVKNFAYQADMFGQGAIQGGKADAAGAEIEVRLRVPVRNLRNLRTGKVFGAVGAFKDRFKPWEANLYLFERP